MKNIINWIGKFVGNKKPARVPSTLAKQMAKYRHSMHVNYFYPNYNEVISWTKDNFDNFEIIKTETGSMICFNDHEDLTALKLKFRI